MGGNQLLKRSLKIAIVVLTIALGLTVFSFKGSVAIDNNQELVGQSNMSDQEKTPELELQKSDNSVPEEFNNHNQKSLENSSAQPTASAINSEEPRAEARVNKAKPEKVNTSNELESTVTNVAKPLSDADFVINVNNGRFKCGDKSNKVFSVLGNDYQYAEAISCEYEGLDKTYSYNGIDVYTYPEGDADYVNEVIISRDIFATERGIKVGMSKAAVIEKYGSNFREIGKQIAYSTGSGTLSFSIKNEVVSSISYAK